MQRCERRTFVSVVLRAVGQSRTFWRNGHPESHRALDIYRGDICSLLVNNLFHLQRWPPLSGVTWQELHEHNVQRVGPEEREQKHLVLSWVSALTAVKYTDKDPHPKIPPDLCWFVSDPPVQILLQQICKAPFFARCWSTAQYFSRIQPIERDRKSFLTLRIKHCVFSSCFSGAVLSKQVQHSSNPWDRNTNLLSVCCVYNYV